MLLIGKLSGSPTEDMRSITLVPCDFSKIHIPVTFVGESPITKIGSRNVIDSSFLEMTVGHTHYHKFVVYIFSLRQQVVR